MDLYKKLNDSNLRRVVILRAYSTEMEFNAPDFETLEFLLSLKPEAQEIVQPEDDAQPMLIDEIPSEQVAGVDAIADSQYILFEKEN